MRQMTVKKARLLCPKEDLSSKKTGVTFFLLSQQPKKDCNVMRKVGILLILACMVGVGAQAQDAPDFQLIMNGLQAKLNAITTGGWDAAAWSQVTGSAPTYNPPFNQNSPSFPGGFHIANGIADDDHLALLQKVLENDACVREILGGTFVDNVRTTFFANRDLVTTRETYFQVRLFNTTRIDINYVISANNRPAWTSPDIQTFTTGQSNNIGVCVDSGIILVGTTCLSESADIPSLWGEDGLMNEAAPGLSEDVANLLAAYLTIGNQSMVDYMQAVMFQTFYRGVLPNIMGLIFNLLGKGLPWDPALEGVGMESFDAGNKAYTPAGGITDINIDVSYNPPFVVAPSDPYIAIRRAVARVYGTSIQAGVLQYWLNWYQVGANGFGTGYSTRLTATGDLDLNGQTNLVAYQNAGMNRAQFLVNAGAGIQFGFTSNPLPASQTVNYGGQAFFNAQAAGGSGGGITYAWFAGPTPGTLQQVATGQTYNPFIDFYSFGGTTNQMYYQCRATTFACGENITTNSTTVVVTGGAPPPINIFTQPVGGQFFPGQTATLTVNAGVAAGNLTYQWQKYDEVFENWINMPGRTAKDLVLTNLTDEDSGQYRCQIFNQIGGKDDKANPVYWNFTDPAVLNIAPNIIINPQPSAFSTELQVGADWTIQGGASVSDGNLEYRWQFNPGTGYVNIPNSNWISAGGSSFTSEWNLVGATINNSGSYRLQVRNTLAPFGTYAINSSAAAINVSSGVTVYVDPTSLTQDGTSWESAFHTLQDAIDFAGAQPDGGEVWVAGGPLGDPIVYDEIRTTLWGGSVGEAGRVTGSLVMRSNVGVYGGFEGYRGGAGAQEDSRLQRNRAQNIAVIDGSLARGGTDPAYHVVVFGGVTAATTNSVLDGFWITGGNAAGVNGASSYHTYRGGGIYNYGSSPTIANCVIYGNSARVSGGGIANELAPNRPADANILNCLITANTALRQADGGAGPGGGNPIRGGGGVFNNQSAPTMNFLTLTENVIDTTYVGDPNQWGLTSGGIFTWNATPLLTNSIVWANTGGSIDHGHPAGPPQDITVTYSDVQGGYAGTGNINADPLLGNAAYQALLGIAGNYVPAVGSPAIDVADPAVTGGDDLLGVLRPINVTGAPSAYADMGAFEVSTQGPTPACINIGIDLVAAPDTDSLDPLDVYDSENSSFEAPVVGFELTYKAFDCTDIPTTSIELVVTDIIGRTGACNATVTVTESEDPVPVCNAITVELDGTGNYALTPADIDALSAGSFDNCTDPANLVVSVLPNTFTCAQAGQNVNVTVTVEDEIGNNASCVAQVTVEDNEAPVLPGVPAAISVDLLPNGTRVLDIVTEVPLLAAGATDNCAVDAPSTLVTYPDGGFNFNCSHIGTNSVVITVFDVNGNSTVGTADVTVNDVSAPVILGADNNRIHITVNGVYTEAMALTGVSAQDVCDGDVTASLVVEAFDEDSNPVAFPIDPEDGWIPEGEISYDFTLVFTAQDGSTNDTQESITLTFFSLLLPEITINGANPYILECPTAYNDVVAGGATAWDPESSSDITFTMTTTVAVNAGVPGAYTVTYSVPVPGYPGLPAVTAVRDVIVEDNFAPVISLLVANPLYWQRGVAFPNNATIRTANDACDGNLTGAIVTTGAVDANTLGSYDLAFDVVDGEGNPADTVELTVIVIDQLEFIQQPVGGRLYTTDPVLDLTAAYRFGANVAGYEWYRDMTGLGFVADTDTPNTVTLSVNPASLAPGTYQYRLRVSDDTGTTASNNAAVEVGNPLASSTLNDLVLQEGVNATWSISVTGGLGAKNYQWQASRAGDKAFVDVVDGAFDAGAYSGAGTATLGLVPFTEAMVGQYQVEVSDDFTAITVGPANLVLDFGVPAASLFGIAALALATALGGAAAVRKRK